MQIVAEVVAAKHVVGCDRPAHCVMAIGQDVVVVVHTVTVIGQTVGQFKPSTQIVGCDEHFVG